MPGTQAYGYIKEILRNLVECTHTIHITNSLLEKTEIPNVHLGRNNLIHRMLSTGAHAGCSCSFWKSEHHNTLIWGIISSSSFVTSKALIDLFRPRIVLPSMVFQVVFVHLF